MLNCPKCKRPLEDESDGIYICCAGAPLRWHCTQCAKVSEGFAFPYGQCPHCDGKLALVEPDRAGDAVALEGIRIAFEIELGGRAFYQRAAVDSADPELRALFSSFAVMEGEHMETLSRRYHIEVPDPSPSFRVEQAAIFGDVPHRPEDPANLFRIAIAFENRAANFFAERAEQQPAGSAERQLYLELAAEEREHADMLTTEYERWRIGKPGLFDLSVPTVAYSGSSMNAAALLLDGHAPDRIAVCCRDRTMTYGELRDRVMRGATVWRAHGVQPGDKVAIKLCDGLEWVVAFLSTIWAGAVAVGVNPRVGAAEWQYMLDEAGFSRILAEDDDETPAPWSARVLQAPLWRREVPLAAWADPTPMDAEAPAFWVHSSGTSGKPKAVVHAHRAVCEIDRVSREGLGLQPDDRLFASSKLFFSYSQTNSLMAGLRMGATIIVEPEWPTAESVVRTVEITRPTVLFTVPSMYRAIVHEEGLAARIAAAGVRKCVSAGEALPMSVRQRWLEQTGMSITNGYGASETLVLVMLDHDGQGFSPSPGIDMRPLNETNDGLPTRLLIRTTTLALGYLDRPQAQAEAFRDGAFCPADLWVSDDGQGHWNFAGREDSLVKISGRWVNLVDLEQELTRSVPDVADAVAVCVPDDDGVDAVALFFVAQNEAAARAALAAGVESMSSHRRPRWLYAIDTLPRTATGKVLRRQLQEMHQERS